MPVEPLFRERRHKVLRISSFESLPVSGDAARLIQCVANILTNAAKYTDVGGHIRVESFIIGAEAVIAVTDDGVGIPADLLPSTFDLFVQNTRTLDRSQGGLGIGLSLVKRLIEMHGGSVSAASSGPGAGASFELRLPLIRQQDVRGGQPAPPLCPPRRILIVDDNKDSAQSLAMLLALDGHEVDSVNTPRDALDRVRSFQPNAVLLDIGLPGMDGYEVARRMRALEGLQPLRIVALTGYGHLDDRHGSRAAGFDAHLVKPVEVTMLQQTLSRLSQNET